MTKSEYSAKHTRRMILFEKQFLKPVFDALHSQIMDVVNDIKREGLDQAKQNLDRLILNDKIGLAVREIYLTVGIYFIKKTLAGLEKQEVKAGGFGINPEWVQALIAYFKSDLLSKVVIPISQSTKQQILEVLIKAEHEGWGVDQIVNALETSDITKARARLIVRTETVQAMFYGQKKGIEDSNFETTQTWISTKDHRTRHAHVLMDGTTVNTGVHFRVPIFKTIKGVDVLAGYDMMEGPGDPSAHIENLANCRCTKVVRVKRDETGRAIRKRHLVAA